MYTLYIRYCVLWDSMSLRMDGLPVLNTACIRNINSSQVIMIICPHIPKWMYNKYIGIGHHPTSENCVVYWPGWKTTMQYV